MSAFNIQDSYDKARRRLPAAPRTSGRRPRSDRGHPRIDRRVLSSLVEATGGHERPPMADIMKRVGEYCHREGLTPPSRATLYKRLETLPTPAYRVAELPSAVRDALYNLGPDSRVPAHQVAFYCFNYGDLGAMCFAASLPWLALYQAQRLPGYRARSRGLLEAVARVRGI